MAGGSVEGPDTTKGGPRWHKRRRTGGSRSWAADGVERVEPEQPRGVLHGAGALTDLLLIQAGEIQARHWIIDSAETFAVDRQVSDASLDDYDALLLGRYLQLRPAPDPRGRGRLRSRRSSATGKPVAAIRHRPWTLAQPDVDELIVAAGGLTTSGSPADLPAFCRAIVEQFAK